MKILRLVGLAAAAALSCGEAVAQEDSAATPRPFVPGGAYDKPYLASLFGRAAVGGYAEGQGRYFRTDGALEEASFVAKRFNLFASTQINEFVRFAAELEFEDAAEEIKLEYAAIDLIVAPALTFRVGMLLSPLGRFNLAHDSPLNEFTDRPLSAEEISGVALSEPGLGILGLVPVGGVGRITYELYAVNGFDDGLLMGSATTRIPLGRGNTEDNNNAPSVVGRLAWSPRLGAEVGVSVHHGAYNVYRVEGETVDDKRNLTIWVLDAEMRVAGVRFEGEGVLARIDIPAPLLGVYAERQRGMYLQAVADFGHGWIAALPRSHFSVGTRFDVVDFDADLPGDGTRQLTLGLNFRPVGETVFKLDYVRGRARDRFNNPSEFAGVAFSAATYF